VDRHIHRSTALAAVTAGPVVLHPAGAAARGLAPDATAGLPGFGGSPWLLPGTDTVCREMAHRACGTNGFTLRPVGIANDFAVLCTLAARPACRRRRPCAEARPARSRRIRPRRAFAAGPVRRSVHAVYRTGTGEHPGTRAPAMSSATWHTSPRAGDRR
jgi:hypothetical protein